MADRQPSRRLPIVAVGIPILVSAVVRSVYLLAQPATDPTFSRPMMDGAVYFEWARSLVAGGGGWEGAYYLAPGFAWFLAGILALFGPSAMALYAAQHAVALAGTLALARTAGRIAGSPAAIATAWLAAGYHPWVFFASRPLADVLGVSLLAVALELATRGTGRAGVMTGVVSGAAVLVRPNLLLAPVSWAVHDSVTRPGWRRGALILVSLATLLTPVLVRNRVVSGHWIPVSSNAGLTFYHGNGPGALGVFTPVAGMSGRVETQRAEATALAIVLGEHALDPVEADRWWGGRALMTRLADVPGTFVLVGRRIVLTVANAELGLDYAPALDQDPVAPVLWVPFAALLALGCAAPFAGKRPVASRAEIEVWLGVSACAVTPILFYVSSRYRLPLAMLLTVPAGVAVGRWFQADRAGRLRSAVVAVLVGALSFLVPTVADRIPMEAAGWSNQAGAWLDLGREDQARRCLDRALELDPSSVPARYQLGLTYQFAGRPLEAETAYREALALDPGHAESAGNLASLLIQRGETGEPIGTLRRALESRPLHEASWTNLIIALILEDRAGEARDALERARSLGVAIEPELVEAVRTAQRGTSGSPAP